MHVPSVNGKCPPAKSRSYSVEMPCPFGSFTPIFESLDILGLLDDVRYKVLR